MDMSSIAIFHRKNPGKGQGNESILKDLKCNEEYYSLFLELLKEKGKNRISGHVMLSLSYGTFSPN